MKAKDLRKSPLVAGPDRDMSQIIVLHNGKIYRTAPLGKTGTRLTPRESVEWLRERCQQAASHGGGWGLTIGSGFTKWLALVSAAMPASGGNAPEVDV